MTTKQRFVPTTNYSQYFLNNLFSHPYTKIDSFSVTWTHLRYRHEVLGREFVAKFSKSARFAG